MGVLSMVLVCSSRLGDFFSYILSFSPSLSLSPPLSLSLSLSLCALVFVIRHVSPLPPSLPVRFYIDINCYLRIQNQKCQFGNTLSFELKVSICKTKQHLIVAIAQYFSILLIKKHEEEFLKRIHEKLIERYPFLFEKITIYHLIFIFWIWAKKSSSSYLLKI